MRKNFFLIQAWIENYDAIKTNKFEFNYAKLEEFNNNCTVAFEEFEINRDDQLLEIPSQINPQFEVRLIEGQRIRCKIIDFIDRDRLLIYIGRNEDTLLLSEINILIKKSNRVRVGWYGLGTGAVLGASLGFISGDSNVEPEGADRDIVISAEIKAVVGAVVFGGLGFGIGALHGEGAKKIDFSELRHSEKIAVISNFLKKK